MRSVVSCGKLDINGFLFFIVALVLVATELGKVFEPLRLLKYSSLLLFALVLLRNKMRIIKTNFNLIAPFVILIGYNILKIALGTPVKFSELIFIASSFVLFLVIKRFDINIRGLSVICIFAFIISLGTNISIDFSLTAFMRSETSTGESNMLPFLFGLFSLFFLVKRDYFWFLINVIFLVLSFKRIVFLGFSVCFIAYVLPNRLRNIALNKWIHYFVNCGLLVVFYFLANGFFNELVREYTGLPIAHFTQGRSTHFELVFPELISRKFEVFFVGIGQGNLLTILSKGLGEVVLFHNDLFKLFVENGFIVFSVFYYFLYKNKNQKQMLIILFINILFLTDNVLIYAPVMLLVLVILKQLEDTLISENSTST